MTDWGEAKARLEGRIESLVRGKDYGLVADIRAALEEIERRGLQYPDDLGISRDAAGLSARCAELRDRLVAQGKRAEAAEAEVELLKRERDAALVHGPEELITELERLRAALEAYDTLSLVIESAMRNEVGLDSRAAGHYERLCTVILQARAALRGGGE